MADQQIDLTWCRCYVRHLPQEARYVLRNGAHNPACPWYSQSRDPVDRQADDEFRAQTEIPAPEISDAAAWVQPYHGTKAQT